MRPNCRWNISNKNYREVINKVKESLGSDYNDKIVKAIADAYINEHDINTLTAEYILGKYPQKNAPQEKISGSQVSQEQQEKEAAIKARKEARDAKVKEAKWAQFADKDMSFEVSSAGDALGKQFSALSAVFKEGTTITLRVGGKKDGIEQTFDIGGYSIEAAYQIIKGYTTNPKGKLIDDKGNLLVRRGIQGKGKLPISKILRVGGKKLAKSYLEDYSYKVAYLPLWKQWAKENPELMKELKKKAKGKILTDRFANTRVSQARALAEILYGAPVDPTTEARQRKYDLQRVNAEHAAKDILKAIRKVGSIPNIKVVNRLKTNDQQVIYLAQGKNSKGQDTTAGDAILSFSVEKMPTELGLFINPFEGQDNAVKKFIQWIMPDSFAALPAELRIEEAKRNTIRTYLSKGGYQKQEIITDGSTENATYAKALRYIIDNFKELRDMYNPTDIIDFGETKQRVKVVLDGKEREVGDNKVIRFAPQELAKDTALDDTNSIKLERVVDKEGNPTDAFMVVFPKDYNALYNKQQKERMFKVIGKAVPAGATLVLGHSLVDEKLLNDYRNIAVLGFTAIGSTEIAKTDGTAENVAVYKKNGITRDSVVREPALSRGDLLEKFHKNELEKKFYLYETDESVMYDAKGEYMEVVVGDNWYPIPTRHSRTLENTSYWSDEAFPTFKKYVDEAVAEAKKKISEGYTVVLPKDAMGNGVAALAHYAPKCYAYLQQQLNGLELYGNRHSYAENYYASATTTVDAVSQAPSESIELNTNVLQSPKAKFRQRYSDAKMYDLARLYSKTFIQALKVLHKDAIKEYKEKLAAATEQEDAEKIQYILEKLTNPATSLLTTLNKIEGGLDAVREKQRELLEGKAGEKESVYGNLEAAADVRDSLQDEFSDYLFELSIPFIREATGIQINAHQKVASMEETQANQNDTAEDVSGMDSPEMGFTFNHRLVDPYKSLSKHIRNIISSIPMRNPNDLRGYLEDSIGEIKYWDASYIYSVIMSRMAMYAKGDASNFVVMTPAEQLSEKDAAAYPYGKPTFPILEDMKARYPWASDLIKKLTLTYNIKSLRESNPGMSNEELRNNPAILAELGNVGSQFYANFCQQFLTYCTMVNNNIITENVESGKASLKRATILNYRGNVRFKDHPMIYNSDQSINAGNVDKVLQMLKEINDENLNTAFWKAIDECRKEEDLYESYSQAPKIVKDACEKTVKALKSCGIVFSDFDMFCLFAEKNPKYGPKEMLGELESCLKSVKGLAKDEDIFESSAVLDVSKGIDRKYQTPQFYWNRFFEKFGDYVTEREYEDNARILGKKRYSFTATSYMNTTLDNLSNPDFEARRKYIEKEYMPYPWFYDKKTGKFKNKLLELAYNNEKTGIAVGHDLLCKKDWGDIKEYQDWTAQDIIELMFGEQTQPTNRSYSCYIAPVLSDSTVCKAVQLPATDIAGNQENSLLTLVGVVMQELERMDIVARRNVILNMQRIAGLISEGRNVSAEDSKYYKAHLNEYNEYKAAHPEELQETDNFDRNGGKFCFIPELNNVVFSYAQSEREGDQFMMGVIRALSKNPNKPSTAAASLKTILKTLENMTPEEFSKRAEEWGITKSVATRVGTGELVQDVEYVYDPEYGRDMPQPKVDAEGNPVMVETMKTVSVAVPMTREECIQAIIYRELDKVLDRKAKNFFYDRYGDPNMDIVATILENDKELNDYYYKNVPQNPVGEFTAEQLKKRREFFDGIVFDRLKTFYYGHTAAMSQFLELMVTDIAYYKDPTKFVGSVDFGKRFKQVNSAGMRLNTNSKYGKTIERSIILEDSVRRTASHRVLSEVLQQAVDDGRIVAEEKDAVMYKMERINSTDGQALRSLTAYRDIMDMLGRNSKELATAIDNLEHNRWTMADFYFVANTLKDFLYGPENQDSGIDDIHLRTMVQHKNSEAVLFAIYNTLVGSREGDTNYSKVLRGLNRAMENIELVDENNEPVKYATGETMKAIDVAQYRSAVKEGAHGVIDINYSREALDRIRKDGVIVIDDKPFKVGNKVFEVSPDDTYYTIEKRLSKLVDEEKISEEDYDKVMDSLEPSEDEIENIITQAIYKNGDKSLGYDDQVLHKLPYASYCIQQPTDDHYTDVEDGTFGSQARHIIMSDIPADFETTINGVHYNREQLRARYNGLVVANLIDCYVKEIEPLFEDTDKSKPAIYRLQERLLGIVRDNPKYGRNMEDALQIVNGTFALPLNNTTILHQIEEIVASMFKNAIHRQKINGGNVIIAADLGYSDKLRIRGKKGADGKYKSIEGIECLMPAHYKKMIKPYLKKETKQVDGETIEYYTLDIKKLQKAGLDTGIGYRIPTEGLYSIMPLIIKGFLPQQSGSSIVVAQEIITLTGGDNDADKLFLMLKNIDGNLKALQSKKGEKVHPLELSKKQRDNEIIDIFQAVLSNPKMTHRWLHPGNYDTATLEAKRMIILKDRRLREQFRIRLGIANDEALIDYLDAPKTQRELNEMYRRVMEKPEGEAIEDKTLTDIFIDFTDQYVYPLSPLYPDTFIEMHQMYMAGVAEKGIFANNTLDHAKLQWTDLRISPSYTFTFEGRKIDRIDPIQIQIKKGRKVVTHYISDDCAELGAASVDNGKFPILKDLNSNTRTANFFGFLPRLALGIDGATALLAQPAVDYQIRTKGFLDIKALKKEIKKLEAWLKGHKFDVKDARFDWRQHNFTVNELRKNIVTNTKSLLDPSHGATIPVVERVASLYRAYNLIVALKEIHSAMKQPASIIHQDSVTNAADTSFGGILMQTKTVEKVNERDEYAMGDRVITGDSKLLVYNLQANKEGKSAVIKKGEKTEGRMHPYYAMYEAMMGTALPITQGFYTLGIEKVRTQIAPYVAIGRKEFQSLTDRLMDFMEGRVYKEEVKKDLAGKLFNDWVVYRLSKTKMFGDDGNMTYDQKRQYYLYEFPAKLMALKETMPELNDFEAIRRMAPKRGMLQLDRGSETTSTLRDFITDSFDRMLASENPEIRKVAKDLFMYCYYLNGFNLSYMSYGNFFSTEFQRAFPEVIQALNAMNTEELPAEDFDNFFEQFILKRGTEGLLKSIPKPNESRKGEFAQLGYIDTGRKISEFIGGLDGLDEYGLYHTIKGTSAETSVVRLNKALSEDYGTVIYESLRMNTTMHYNAGQTVDEMTEVVYDQEKIDANKRLGTKKRNKSSVMYDVYQAAKNMQAVAEERDANVPEIADAIPASRMVDASANEDSREETYQEVEVAAGVKGVDIEEAQTDGYSDYDAFISKRVQVLSDANTDQEKESLNATIEEGQSIIKEHNDDSELCISKKK